MMSLNKMIFIVFLFITVCCAGCTEKNKKGATPKAEKASSSSSKDRVMKFISAIQAKDVDSAAELLHPKSDMEKYCSKKIEGEIKALQEKNFKECIDNEIAGAKKSAEHEILSNFVPKNSKVEFLESKNSVFFFKVEYADQNDPPKIEKGDTVKSAILQIYCDKDGFMELPACSTQLLCYKETLARW